jgi:ribosomal protein L11 methylase PrmA
MTKNRRRTVAEGMESQLSEFDPERAGRLWVAVSGDPIRLAALAEELRRTGAEIREGGEALVALIPAAADIDRMLVEVAERIDRAGAAGRAAVVETRIVSAEDGWQKGETIPIGRHFRIALVDKGHVADPKTILLTGSSVFGSGLHPSTRLVVRAVDELAGKEPFAKKVLDVGTGSGLLAMIAARRGAKALGIDIANEAVSAARRNVAANGLDAQVGIEATPLSEVTGSFDLILANLTASVQLRLADALLPRLAVGGELIVSGLLGRQQEEMASFWQTKGVEVVNRYAEGKWRALRLRAGMAASGKWLRMSRWVKAKSNPFTHLLNHFLLTFPGFPRATGFCGAEAGAGREAGRRAATRPARRRAADR